RWWEKNREKYPEAVRVLEIPKLPRERPLLGLAAVDPPADLEGIRVQDLRAGEDEKKRYFLIGEGGDKPPADGYGLLIVVPGGDGSIDFQPFVRRIRENALDDRWLVVQAVAPRWDDDQFNKVVWPTARLPYPAARFTTED